MVAYLALLLGLTTGLCAFLLFKQENDKRIRARFEAQITADRDMMVQGLVQYIYAFHGVHALFLGGNTVSERTWRQAMANIAWTQVPGILEIGYAEYVPGKDGPSVPIRFTSSKLTNSLHVVGYDMMSEVRHREALNRTGEYGATISTTRTRLLSSEAFPPRSGHVVFCPLYKYERPDSSSLEVERRVLQGFAFVIFDEIELWASLIKRVQHSPIGYAPDPGRAGKELIASGERSLRKTITMGTWGLRWNLVCVARPSFIDPGSRSAPYLVLVAGASCSVLIFLLVARRVQSRIRNDAAKVHDEQLRLRLEEKISERTAELRGANEQLQQSLSKELELGEMKTTFLSTVSHEFRTPLGIIVSSVGILDRYFDRLTGAQRSEHLRTIQESAARMIELMEGALLFSKAEAGLVDFERKPIDVLGLCHRLVEEVKSSTNERCPIDFAFTGDFSNAQADERLLRTILVNLLTNAVKYSPNGVPVHFQLCRKHDGAIFVIKDEGIGIPVADLPKLFTPFRRAQNVANYAGSGLGLVLVKKCVEIHRGTLNLDSKEGRGTTATVELPLFVTDETKPVK